MMNYEETEQKNRNLEANRKGIYTQKLVGQRNMKVEGKKYKERNSQERERQKQVSVERRKLPLF